MRFLFFLIPVLCFAHPFDYDLHLTTIPGNNPRTILCLHGSGANYEIAEALHELTDATLVSFNFPDYDYQYRNVPDEQISFGTIQELLPPLYVLKNYVIDQGLPSIDLYGFSAGGAAAVNLIAVLNTTRFDVSLQKIGIGASEKKQILSALQHGIVLLDTPLKSMEELIDIRGSTPQLELIANNYKQNGLQPIESLRNLKGLSLNIILHFQQVDEIIYNRDDSLFIDALKQTQKNASIVIADEGGHLTPHRALWKKHLELCK
jgi:hypothetical protein